MPVKCPDYEYAEVERMLCLPDENIRTTPDGIPELAANMSQHGQRIAIILSLDERQPGKYVILDGWRRWLAAGEARIDILKALICKTRPSTAELKLLQLSLALHHAKPSDADLSQACIDLLALNPTWDQKDIAANLSLSEPMVSAYCSVRKASPAVQAAYRAGEISVHDLRRIVRCGDGQDEALAQRMAGLKRDQLVAEQDRRKTPATETVRMSRVRLPVAGADITISGAEIGVDEVINILKSLLKEAQRAQQQSLDIKTLAAVLRDRHRSEQSNHVTEVQ